MHSPAWLHSEIQEIFPNIFFVTGTNITNYNNVELQHSRNMIIVRNDNKLSLIRIGAFHGRDDAFYLDRYHAKLWSLKGMNHDNNRLTDVELFPNGPMPFPACSLFVFESSVHPEGILHISQDGGILITCDSIKNWLKPDLFFSPITAKLYEEQGFFGTASISSVWKQVSQVKYADFLRLQSLEYRHLLSAHGEPLLNNAYGLIAKTIAQEFGA